MHVLQHELQDLSRLCEHRYFCFLLLDSLRCGERFAAPVKVLDGGTKLDTVAGFEDDIRPALATHSSSVC